MHVSERFRLALYQARARGRRQYQLAQQAGVDPTTLSALVNAITPLRENDERIVKVGAILGLSAAECFEESSISAA